MTRLLRARPKERVQSNGYNYILDVDKDLRATDKPIFNRTKPPPKKNTFLGLNHRKDLTFIELN